MFEPALLVNGYKDRESCYFTSSRKFGAIGIPTCIKGEPALSQPDNPGPEFQHTYRFPLKQVAAERSTSGTGKPQLFEENFAEHSIAMTRPARYTTKLVCVKMPALTEPGNVDSAGGRQVVPSNGLAKIRGHRVQGFCKNR